MRLGLSLALTGQRGGGNVPANAITFNGKPITYNGEFITYGAS